MRVLTGSHTQLHSHWQEMQRLGAAGLPLPVRRGCRWESPGEPDARWAGVSPFDAAVLTGVCLCATCSCHEITERLGQAPRTTTPTKPASSAARASTSGALMLPRAGRITTARSPRTCTMRRSRRWWQACRHPRPRFFTSPSRTCSASGEACVCACGACALDRRSVAECAVPVLPVQSAARTSARRTS